MAMLQTSILFKCLFVALPINLQSKLLLFLPGFMYNSGNWGKTPDNRENSWNFMSACQIIKNC